jgi:hypothetical protein
MEDTFFKNDAKQIVDMAFNNKLFKEELTRDDFNAFEDLIQFLLQTRFESYKKIHSLVNSIDNKDIKKEIKL